MGSARWPYLRIRRLLRTLGAFDPTTSVSNDNNNSYKWGLGIVILSCYCVCHTGDKTWRLVVSDAKVLPKPLDTNTGTIEIRKPVYFPRGIGIVFRLFLRDC